jgi:signal transduction histidine kinase/ActR/RegA family two-component response regulator
MRPSLLLIRTRLALGLGLILAFMVGLLVVSLFAIRRSHEQAALTLSASAARTWQANVIRDAAHDLDNSFLTALLAKDDMTRSLCVIRMRTAQATVRTVADDLAALPLAEDSSRLLADIRNEIADVQKSGENVIRALGARALSEAQAMYQDHLRPSMDRLRQTCALLVAQQNGQRESDHLALVRADNVIWRALMVVGAFVILVVIGIGMFLNRSITQPLQQAAHMAGRLAEGEPVDQIEIRGRDEAAQLLRAMNLMATRIHENRSLEHQLQQSQKLETVGRLAGGVAHDFNNLLTVITTYADLLLEEHCSDQELAMEGLDEIKKAAMRAADLTRQLLAFSRKQIMELKVLELNALLVESEKMLRRIIGEDIELRTCYASTAKIRADRGQLNQVIMNLVVNARDAMPRGGTLTLETVDWEADENYARTHTGVAAGHYVAIVIRDNGVGMTRELQEHIFEPFFTTKEPGRGTGLGLSTVYGIVKQSDGHITVESEPGRGTTFKISLPRMDNRQAEVELRASNPASIHGTEEILLVEDEDQVRKVTARVLRQHGYSVREACGGREAIVLLQDSDVNPALLLTDMVMPGISGPQVAEQAAAYRPGIRVLFMSGYTEHAVIDQLPRHEAANFIQKPFTGEALARKARQVLDARRGGGVITMRRPSASQAQASSHSFPKVDA